MPANVLYLLTVHIIILVYLTFRYIK